MLIGIYHLLNTKKQKVVEYFLDTHTDEFKREVYFHKGVINK